ncbi:MAG: endolytic transglycosylase MltG [Thermacetogeniaceae bacterium]
MAKPKGWFDPFNPVHWGAILFVVGCLWIGAQLYVDRLTIPVGVLTHNTKTSVISIKKGESLRELGDTLQGENMIASSTLFVLYARLTGVETQIKAGSYRITNTLSMKEILRRIVGGEVLRYRVAIPEGYTDDQIARLLVSKGIVTNDGWQAALKTEQFAYPFLKDAPAGPKRLEGFLFPATYDLYADFTASEIQQTMLERFETAFTPDLQQRALQEGLSVRQVVILASIVEREAKLESERPIIASVFLNRLKHGMRLESCATVQYVLGKPKEKLTNQDVRIPSPYNTYLHDGLPPGPISNPGLASIRAVLYPANSNYYYFVAKGDGSHVFSTTFGQHQMATRQFAQ